MTRNIDILNFILIWVSLVLAFRFPFELFLFSYIVLGPLHYLTEINWLDKKNYFLNEQKDRKGFLLIAGIILLFLSASYFTGQLGTWEISKGLHERLINAGGSERVNALIDWGGTSIFIALFFAFIYHLTSSWKNRLILTGICLALSFFYFKNPHFLVWIGVFLPTIIHVFLFTLLFMWFGTKKSGSGWGYANIFSMILVVFIIVNAKVSPVKNSLDPAIVDMTVASNFHGVNYEINRILGFAKDNRINFYTSYFWKAQIFIAFAYTYHYLNWFSKTSIIQWHKIEKRKLVIAVVIWLVSIGLYTVNFRFGALALFVMSALHVILEFPLNMLSVKELLLPRFLFKTKNALN
ncbi:MAG: hypothetical protein DWQ44_03180 [Bacteroidetes bacterium]|nr:MAG: hypothetical protein DWQ33_04625 [Bacteroidota bacterium]REJ99994.1 MAG: hypothetical protein DWQ39_13895 [Bacteroidota bacterium]REK35826.1 MAG: hypothetical protein DWQ44_03180 [Bacteroidota bacterium]REK49303.1 MAG: hypothetical protein DWQ48_07675 [Bacteroidota bacterium]